MSTRRGRISIDGFHSGIEDRDEVELGPEEDTRALKSRWWRFADELRRDRLALMGGFVVLVMLLAAVFAWPIAVRGVTIQPFALAPHDPFATRVGGRYEAPSVTHPFGTDRIGRDLFSRVMYGTRFSVSMGLVVTAIAASFGVIYGGISGYFGGKVDDLMMRFVDLIFAFPGLVLAMVIVAMLGRGYWHLVLAFVAVGWAGYARLIRGEILKVKQNEYVLAAKALGAKDRTVLFRHIVPNAIAPVIVQATLAIGTVVIGIAALGFLGIGFAPGTPEWGTILSAERDTVVSHGADWRWWATIFPGIAIFLFVMSTNMIGDAVNDALDAQAGEETGHMGGG